MGFFKKKPKNKQLQLVQPLVHYPVINCGDDYIPIWFEFEGGTRVDLNSPMIIEDPRGLYHFLRCNGQQLIAQQRRFKTQMHPKLSPIIFYERDYRKWRL